MEPRTHCESSCLTSDDFTVYLESVSKSFLVLCLEKLGTIFTVRSERSCHCVWTFINEVTLLFHPCVGLDKGLLLIQRLSNQVIFYRFIKDWKCFYIYIIFFHKHQFICVSKNRKLSFCSSQGKPIFLIVLECVFNIAYNLQLTLFLHRE